MQIYIRKYPVLIILFVLFATYALWWMYRDYDLSLYPHQITANLQVPPRTKIVQQKEFVNKTCRSGSVLTYYATNLSWKEVVAFYQKLSGK